MPRFVNLPHPKFSYADFDARTAGVPQGDSLKPNRRDGFEALRIAEAAVHSATTGAPVMLKDWEPDDA